MRRIPIFWAAALVLAVGCVRQPPLDSPQRVYTEQELRAFGAEISQFLELLTQRQREYYRTQGRYAGSLIDLDMSSGSGYDVRIVEASERGWAAEAGRATPPVRCSVYAGVVDALPRPTSAMSRAGEPYCLYAQPAG